MRVLIAVCLLVLIRPLAGQNNPEMEGLKRQLAAYQDQLRAMQGRLEALETLVQRLTGGPSPAPAPSPDPPAAAPPAAPAARLHISGFADATGVFRSTYTAAGITTPFGAIPLERAPEAQLQELRGSASHSRLSFRLDTRLGGGDMTAYAETDFLGVSPTNVFAGSNAHPLRARLYWAQWRGRRWEMLGGQSWSLLAPNRRGISPDPADIMSTQVIDPNYNVGLVWTRQATLRFTRKWDRVTAAVALENPEQNILDPREVGADVRGLASRVTPGSNLLPDVVVKAAYDAGAGHLEAAAVVRSFQAYAADRNAKRRALGAGVSVAGVWHAARTVDLVSQNYAASGGGRYAQGLVPDVVVRPDGNLVRVFTVSLLEGLELRLRRSLTAYGYTGLVYGRRAAYRLSNGDWAGFGAPAGSAVDNRTVSQTTAGFRHTFWQDDGRGALSYAVNYSYLVRKLWESASSGDRGHSHMIYTSFRYNLP